MLKAQRIGVYGLCRYNGKIVAIKKKGGPFTGKLDLPGGKIEHSEKHLEALARELKEELGVKKITSRFEVFSEFGRIFQNTFGNEIIMMNI